ncbi:MAG: hypothetical protein JWL65_7140 [Gammaproteobacteria bacterium]|jgi:predicted SnoaL-like aldol condensation-catalyzing enzyme|nr:hypothetical protein [Gammaproteobacteria bacterium]
MSRSNRFATAVLAGLFGAALPWLSTQAATYTPQEEANIKLVAEFYAALDRGDAAHDLKQKIRSIAEQYLQPDYIQHAEGARTFGSGREGFIRMFEQMPAMPAAPGAGAPPPPQVMALMADKDRVIRVSARSMPGPGGPVASYIFNMFRVQDGKLAEHWDSSSAGMMPLGNEKRKMTW